MDTFFLRTVLLINKVKTLIMFGMFYLNGSRKSIRSVGSVAKSVFSRIPVLNSYLLKHYQSWARINVETQSGFFHHTQPNPTIWKFQVYIRRDQTFQKTHSRTKWIPQLSPRQRKCVHNVKATSYFFRAPFSTFLMSLFSLTSAFQLTDFRKDVAILTAKRLIK